MAVQPVNTTLAHKWEGRHVVGSFATRSPPPMVAVPPENTTLTDKFCRCRRQSVTCKTELQLSTPAPAALPRHRRRSFEGNMSPHAQSREQGSFLKTLPSIRKIHGNVAPRHRCHSEDIECPTHSPSEITKMMSVATMYKERPHQHHHT